MFVPDGMVTAGHRAPQTTLIESPMSDHLAVRGPRLPTKEMISAAARLAAQRTLSLSYTI
jgi:hypothetical protein